LQHSDIPTWQGAQFHYTMRGAFCEVIEFNSII
jgi:hypothetical protein